MRKLLTKAKIRLLTLGLVIMIMIAAAGNVSLFANRDIIANRINGYLDYDISIGSIFYAFPNRIVIAPLRIKKSESSSDGSSLVLAGIAARFSIWDLIINGSFKIPEVTVYSSNVSYFSLSQFLEDNFKRILELIRESAGNDIKIRVNETLLNFDRKGEPDYIAMELYLTIQEGVLVGTGLFRADQYKRAGGDGGSSSRITKGWPLWYRIKGELKSDGLLIDQFIFNSGNFYSKIWGSLRSGLLKVNGFAFMDTTKQNPDEMGYSFPHYIKNFPTDSGLSNVDTYVLDMDGKIRLSYPVIAIEQFYFNYNNIPLTLKGSVSLLNPLTIDAGLSLSPSREGGWPGYDYIEQADMKFHSTWEENVLNTNGHLDLDFHDQASNSLMPEMAKFTFKDLNVYQDQSKRAVFGVSSGDIVYFTNNNEHKISIHDFKAVTNKEMEGHKMIEVSAPFYQGTMNGRVWYDSTEVPTKITSLITLTDVDTDALEELLVHFAKFNGRMSSNINFTNVPQMDLSGDITVFDGRLTDFAFFNWVGDSFDLPALKVIKFDRGLAQFAINKEKFRLHDIRLRTDDIHIGGYYNIDNKNLVASELSLDLSREFLDTSPKFKPLLKTYEGSDSHLNFDFRLSGNVDAMNFQWLPSDVKKQIQSRIPDFVERMIEQDIDKMMDADSKGAK